jgi:hypothetical protein
MAQVVLFNNIISGYLEAEDKTGKKHRFGTGWQKEQKGLESEAKIDERFFSGFKQSQQGNSSSNVNEVNALGLLNSVLGRKEKSD